MSSYTLLESAPADAVVEMPHPAPQDLWQHYHQPGSDDGVENALVEEYLPLVKTVVGRLAMTLPSHISADDLYSAGLVGLLQAIRSFSTQGGASFETFARFRIRGAVLDELRRMDWVPRLVHDKARKIQNKLSELEQRLGGPPSEEQMARALGISLPEYHVWLEEIRPVSFVCLDAVPRNPAQESTLPHESIPDDTQEDPSDSAARSELKDLISQRILQLPPIQQKVLALYYFEDLRLREIAEAFGLTESRISQIHSQAILSIRSFIERQEALAMQRGAEEIS
jgi:RNA polymerase sigma factor for flagellar operon FliA